MVLTDIFNYFISLLVVCSPLSALPALLNLCYGKSDEEKKQIAVKASMAVALILVIVTWVGLPLLNIFGIRIPAFQIAGGFVLALVALSMLNARPNRIQQSKEDESEAVLESLSPKGERFLLQGSPHGAAPQALKPTFRRL
ncbi:MAG TPA: MarC family protein [Rhabdochlamydiaceae bacterium]|jgi:multiple antibiotic resistance protein|nr:MarC family protein [Rhabdochlamydiaceae bacterium]